MNGVIMRRSSLFILYLSFALSSLVAQTYDALPQNKPSVIQNDSVMYISLQVDSLTEEERYFNPIYLIVAQGKEYLKELLIRASVCDCDTTIPNRRIGVFSVAPNKYISFSQGNLQYFPAADLWKFADTQYEYLGASNKYLSSTYRNWVDLFGWSGDNTTAPFGVSISTNQSDYAGDFIDWGTNWICGDAPDTWRTMSMEEWNYLRTKRKNANQLIGVAQVNGINGLILLPDNWICPDGIVFKAGFSDNCGVQHFSSFQTINQQNWQEMENAGAVFLPAACRRNGKIIDYIQYGSRCWTSTISSDGNANYFFFNSCAANLSSGEQSSAHSVRLVHDTMVFTPEYVDLGLSVKWATCNVGATRPEEYGDNFAYGETQPKKSYTWATYKWCKGSQNTLTKYCNDSAYGYNGYTDSLMTLEATDDAATVHWGSNWRMPTSDEVMELIKSCRWTWKSINGVFGVEVTAPNGNSIFLPSTIIAKHNGIDYHRVIYRSSSKYSKYPSSGIALSAGWHSKDTTFLQTGADSYCVGWPIRPVYNPSVTQHSDSLSNK